MVIIVISNKYSSIFSGAKIIKKSTKELSFIDFYWYYIDICVNLSAF